MFLSIVILALCTLFNAGSAEICFSCFTATMSDSRFMDQGQWGHNETATSWPEYTDCYHPSAYEPMECWPGSGCERMNAEVEFFYEGEYSTFSVIYLGCGNSTAVVNGCTFEPYEILNYLQPFQTTIDGKFGLSLDWDSVIQGQACRCTGDYCNGANYVKTSSILMVILSLLTLFWTMF